MHIAKKIAYILVIIGALNWGLYGVSGLDLVQIVFGSIPMIAGILYVLIGLSGILLVLDWHKKCSCSKNECSCNIEVNTSTEAK